MSLCNAANFDTVLAVYEESANCSLPGHPRGLQRRLFLAAKAITSEVEFLANVSGTLLPRADRRVSVPTGAAQAR